MFRKVFLLMIALSFTAVTIKAQVVYTKNGVVSFFSKAPIEDIRSDNNEVVSLLNKQTGELQFSLLIKGFHFKKSLMEEHFNEDYMESNKYPKASFKGKVAEISKVDFATDGSYPVTVSGELTIHGVVKKITESGLFSIKNGVVTANASFKIAVNDFAIRIPGIVKEHIAQILDVTVSCEYNQKIQ